MTPPAAASLPLLSSIPLRLSGPLTLLLPCPLFPFGAALCAAMLCDTGQL